MKRPNTLYARIMMSMIGLAGGIMFCGGGLTCYSGPAFEQAAYELSARTSCGAE